MKAVVAEIFGREFLFMHGARSRLGVLVFAGVLLGMGAVERAVAGGQGVATEAQSSATAQPVEATPGSIHFENVPIGERYTQGVRLSNRTNSPARITNIASSRPEFAITGITLPVDLAAGANVDFTVGYKPNVATSIAARITIQTNLSTTPLQLDVKASAATKESGLAADQMSLDFAVVAIGKSDTRELQLQNNGNTDVAISKIGVSGANFSIVGNDAIQLRPGQKASVQLQFSPDRVGNRNGVISIVSNAQDSPLRIPVSGSGAAMSGHTVELKWEESLTEVVGYNIYRSSETDGSFTKLAASPVSGSSYTDMGLAAGHTYLYLIKAVDTNNVESDDSEQISVAVPQE